MAFIPESDWVYRGRRSCGFEGQRANEQQRESLRHTALTGHEPSPVPMYLTRPDRHVSTVNANIFSNSRTWLNRVAEKPTHDFPGGGKRVGAERRNLTPSPIITPEYKASITGSVRRMGPVDIPPEKLRTIWSEGRDVAVRTYAESVAHAQSPIPFQNPLPARLQPLRTGTKTIVGRSDTDLDARPPPANCVDGFRGMGNRIEYGSVQKPQRHSVRSSAVPYGELGFFGERKPPMSYVGAHPQ